jgi:hypothetical protein
MGFAPDQIGRWLEAAGLRDVRLEAQAPAARGGDLPATFIASGVVPREAGR